MTVEIKTLKERLNGRKYKKFSLTGFDYTKFFGSDFKWSEKADDNLKIVISVGIVMLLYGFGVFDRIPYSGLQELIMLVSAYLSKKVLDLLHFYNKSN